MRLNLTSTAATATARVRPVRFAALLFALLAAFSVSSFGGHAHAATAVEAHLATDYTVPAAGKRHAHEAHVPCDDTGADHGGQDNCCISASTCGVCAPVPSAEFLFLSQGAPAAAAIGAASLPRDPPTLSRPPKLSVTA